MAAPGARRSWSRTPQGMRCEESLGARRRVECDHEDDPAVIHDGPILPGDGLGFSVSVDDAFAADPDWYSLRNIGTAEKDLTVELSWSGPVEELDLSIRDRNGEAIPGIIAWGPGGKTFTTRQPVTVSEVRIEVAPTTHAAKYELRVEVD